jgi:hypothetical protein
VSDHGRADVYAAELAAFEATVYEVVTPFENLLELGQRVMNSAWWPGPAASIVPARADAGSSSTVQGGDRSPVIRLAAPQMTPATLIHELAHVLGGVGAGHGPRFRRAHVDLALATFGADEARWLSEAYAAAGRPVGGAGTRTWQTPPAAFDRRQAAFAL